MTIEGGAVGIVSPIDASIARRIKPWYDSVSKSQITATCSSGVRGSPESTYQPRSLRDSFAFCFNLSGAVVGHHVSDFPLLLNSVRSRIQGHTRIEWLSFALVRSPEHLPLHESPLRSASGVNVWVIGVAHDRIEQCSSPMVPDVRVRWTLDLVKGRLSQTASYADYMLWPLSCTRCAKILNTSKRHPHDRLDQSRSPVLTGDISRIVSNLSIFIQELPGFDSQTCVKKSVMRQLAWYADAEVARQAIRLRLGWTKAEFKGKDTHSPRIERGAIRFSPLAMNDG